MLMYADVASQMRLPTDLKKGSVQHVHLFELIEMHKKFILARARGSNDYGPEAAAGGANADPPPTYFFDPSPSKENFIVRE